MTRVLCSAIMFFLSACLHAKSLGTLGQTFPVAEKSLLTLIYERLHTLQREGQLEEVEKAWVKKVESHVLRPTPVPLNRTNKTLTHYYTPIASLNTDITDATGRIILKRGMSANALTQLPGYQPVWVFLNFDDPAQRHFADVIKNKYSDIQWILTCGNVREAEQHINESIYFDQEGRITKKLSIAHVPALVTRSKDSLKIVEFAIGENGHAF